MKRILSVLLAVMLLVSLLSGCGKTDNSSDLADTSGNQDTIDNTVGDTSDTTDDDADNVNNDNNTDKANTFTDDCGRTVELPDTIDSIVPSGPLAQIMLFAIVPDLFVGVSSDWDSSAAAYLNEEYYNLPVIGQLYGGKGEVNLEELAVLGPQLLIDIGEAKDSAAEDLDSIQEQIGIPCIHIEANLYTMPEAYRKVGKLLGREDEAERIASYYEGWIEKTANIVDEIGRDNLANVIYCVGEDGLSVLAKDSYHAEILDMLTNNVAVVEDISSKGSGNPVDMEQLLLWDPDYIIFSPDGGYDNASTNDTWQQLTAIANGNYIETPYGPYNWMTSPPSVQRILALIWLPAALYPDYIDYDVYEATAEYFEMFYHAELTREQFDILTENAFIN